MENDPNLTIPSFPAEIQLRIFKEYYNRPWALVFTRHDPRHIACLIPDWDLTNVDVIDSLLLVNHHISRLAQVARAELTSIAITTAVCSSPSCYADNISPVLLSRAFCTHLLALFPNVTTLDVSCSLNCGLGDTQLYMTLGTLHEVLSAGVNDDFLTVLEHEVLRHDTLELRSARVTLPPRCSQAELAHHFGDLTVNFPLDLDTDTWCIDAEDQHLCLRSLRINFSINRTGCRVIGKLFQSCPRYYDDCDSEPILTMPAGYATLRAFRSRYTGAPWKWIWDHPETDMRRGYT